MHYFYRKSNRGHGGCPPFGESVIRGFTVRVLPFLNNVVHNNIMLELHVHVMYTHKVSLIVFVYLHQLS